jgi:hypothetical protein
MTSGVDWSAIAAAGATVIAAVAGIWGTAFTAKRAREQASKDLRASLDAAADNLLKGINAENRRIRRGDKRKVYAGFQTAMNKFIVSTSHLENYGSDAGDRERIEMINNLAEAFTAIQNGLSELMLTAPQTIRSQAEAAVSILQSYSQGIEKGEQPEDSSSGFLTLRDRLYDAMRADLEQ